jgi:hypothetical protein
VARVLLGRADTVGSSARRGDARARQGSAF